MYPLFVFSSLVLILGACQADSKKRSARLVVDEAPSESYLVGIAPENFECKSLVDMDFATTTFGGRVVKKESLHSPPVGVPKSCHYESHASGRPPIQWSFDLDCRDGALKDAGQLMVQYATAPQATPVRVGQSGLDHNDASLLFIDDDTPCYGRVVGPSRELRLALALHISAALTPHSAPTGAHFLTQ